jgi:hypothetical protein
VSFPFCPAVSAETHLLGIVGAEFIAKELTVGSAPRLQLSIYDRQTFSAKRAASRCAGITEASVHLLSLTPDQKRHPRSFGCISESFTPDSCQNDTHLSENSRDPQGHCFGWQHHSRRQSTPLKSWVFRNTVGRQRVLRI